MLNTHRYHLFATKLLQPKPSRDRAKKRFGFSFASGTTSLTGKGAHPLRTAHVECAGPFRSPPRTLIGVLLVVAISRSHTSVCARSAHCISCVGPALRGNTRNVQRKRNSETNPISIPCSKLAALVGKDPSDSPGDQWRYILKYNFKQKYDALARAEPLLLTSHDQARREHNALKPDMKKRLKKTKQVYVEAPRAQKIDMQSLAPTLSSKSAKLFERDVRMTRGRKAEKKGLARVESEDKKLVKIKRAEIKTLNDAVASLDQECKGRIAEASSKNEVMAIEQEFLKRQTELQTEIRRLSDIVTQHDAPITPKGDKLFRSSISPGVMIVGKIDASRTPKGGYHIIEHKARQYKLFKKVRLFEKIQCLGYIHLAQGAHPKSRVRCFLAETFGDKLWVDEVEPDPSFWNEDVVKIVNQRAQRLRSLIEENASPGEILAWLEGLNQQ